MGSNILHPNRVDYYGAFHVHLVEAYTQGKNALVDILKRVKACKTGSKQ
jgi:hypothetical protein